MHRTKMFIFAQQQQLCNPNSSEKCLPISRFLGTKYVFILNLHIFLLLLPRFLPVPVKDVESVLGGSAELPCDILPEDAHDDVYLVLWFKDEATKPMYRYRKKALTKTILYIFVVVGGTLGSASGPNFQCR